MWYHHAPFSPLGYAVCSLPRLFSSSRSLPHTVLSRAVGCLKNDWDLFARLLRGDVVVISPLPAACPHPPPIARPSRAVPGCIRFRLGNRFRPAPRVEQNGEQDGEGLRPRA